MNIEAPAIDEGRQAKADVLWIGFKLAQTYSEARMYLIEYMRLFDQPRSDHTPALSESESGAAAHDGVQPERSSLEAA